MPVPKRTFHYDHASGKVVETTDNPHVPVRGPMINNAYARRPIKSAGIGFQTRHVADARKVIKEIGASGGCTVDNEGDVTFHGRKARKKVLKHFGYHDNDGGYGD